MRSTLPLKQQLQTQQGLYSFYEKNLGPLFTRLPRRLVFSGTELPRLRASRNPARITQLSLSLDSGRRVTASTVVDAPGITHFAVVPEWVEQCLSPERWSHTSHLVRFDELRGKRCLIIGGRQSAFEWGALFADEGAEEVHIVYRHDSPEFSASE
jgi:thioredoxin reductase